MLLMLLPILLIMTNNNYAELLIKIDRILGINISHKIILFFKI